MSSEFSEVGRIQCDFKLATFATAERRKATRQEDQEYSDFLREALEVSVCLDKYPKSVIEVNVLVLEDDGAALSAAICCSSLALADAGVEMYDLVSSCSAVEITDNHHIVLDPTATEERYSTGEVVCAYMASLNEVTQIKQQGDMQYTKVTEAIDLCCDGCAKIAEYMKQTLVKK